MENNNGLVFPSDLVECYGIAVSKSVGGAYYFNGTSMKECNGFKFQSYPVAVIEQFIEEIGSEETPVFDQLFADFKR